jgi:type I restriction enzyme, S subunit
MSATTQEQKPETIAPFGDADLPEGWAQTDLGTVAELVSGAGFPLAHQGRLGLPYPFFKVGNLADVDSGERLKEAPDTVDDMMIKELRAKIIPPNSVLFAKIGMAIGLNRRRLSDVHCCIDNNMMAAVPTNAIGPRYLLRFLETVPFMDLASATTVPSLRKSELDRVTILLPPLAEQKRLVARIEELLCQVNAARARLARVAQILKRFRQAVLAAACSGRLTQDFHQEGVDSEGLPSDWRSVTVGELLIRNGIFDGPFGSNLKTSDYTESGVRVIRMANVGWLKFIGSKQAFISEKKYKSLTRHTVGPGDIIFSSFIGDEIRSCVLPALPTKAIAKADCFCLRPDPTRIDQRYLTLQLSSQESYDALHEHIHGATRPRVNTTQVRELSVRVCPVLEQKEIVRRVEVLFARADAIEKQVAAATKRAEKLTQAILAKAFRGELVPTEAELARREGREYEPASALLERIRASHEGAAQTQDHRNLRRRTGTGARKLS